MARQPDTSKHKLSGEEYGRIFSDEIEPILLGKVKTRHQSKPRLIMLGGQPGSGKTSRLLFSVQDPLHAHPDAAEWVNRAIDVAIREGCQTIDSACNDARRGLRYVLRVS